MDGNAHIGTSIETGSTNLLERLWKNLFGSKKIPEDTLVNYSDVEPLIDSDGNTPGHLLFLDPENLIIKIEKFKISQRFGNTPNHKGKLEADLLIKALAHPEASFYSLEIVGYFMDSGGHFTSRRQVNQAKEMKLGEEIVQIIRRDSLKYQRSLPREERESSVFALGPMSVELQQIVKEMTTEEMPNCHYDPQHDLQSLTTPQWTSPQTFTGS